MNSKWWESRIRENTSGYIHCEGSSDNFKSRIVYRTRYIDGKLFYTTKYPECPPDIARLFDWNVRNALTPQELMVIDLKMLNLPESPPYNTPPYLRLEGGTRINAFWKEIGVTVENLLGTKSLENTCGYCGKTGFKKVVDPKTLYTHNQKCDACGNSIMIDSWYFAKYFEKGDSMTEEKTEVRAEMKNEEKTESYLNLDDAELGKLVKRLAAGIQDRKGNDSLTFTACATFLVCMTAAKNSTKSEIELKGVTDANQEVGDWKLNIRRVSAPSEQDVLHDNSETGLSTVWIFEHRLDRVNLAVQHRQSDGKYVPVCDGVHGEPVDSQAKARVLAYQMRLKQVTSSLECEISKIPRRV